MEARGAVVFIIGLLAAVVVCGLCPSSAAQLMGTPDCALSDYKLSPGRVSCMENLELMIPLPIDGDGIADDAWGEFTDIFFFSLQLFWPLDKTRIIVMAPANRPEVARQTLVDRVRMATEKGRLAGGRVAFHVAPKGQEDEKGWDRQQRLMFFADNYTDAEFVGFCDSDTVFTGVVQEQDLFDELRRPHIMGLYGRPVDDTWPLAPNVTQYALGVPEPFRAMNQFPLIIRTAHLREIRDYITRHLGTRDFDDAFTLIRDLGRPMYSQFSIMAVYLWYHRRDDYHWHIQEFEPGWNGTAPIGQAPNTPEHLATLQPYMHEPLPRIASHFEHEWIQVKHTKSGWIVQNDAFLRLMQQSVCASVPSSAASALGDKGAPSFCRGLDFPAGFRWQWMFEGRDWSWHPCAPLAGQRRHARMVPRAWPAELIERIQKYVTETRARGLRGRRASLGKPRAMSGNVVHWAQPARQVATAGPALPHMAGHRNIVSMSAEGEHGNQAVARVADSPRRNGQQIEIHVDPRAMARGNNVIRLNGYNRAIIGRFANRQKVSQPPGMQGRRLN